MPVDAFASEPHYADHLAAIWWAIPAADRGTFYALGGGAERARAEGIGVTLSPPPAGDDLCLVASFSDSTMAARPLVYVEHGAGQTYAGEERTAVHPSYSGTLGHDRVALFVCPSETVAARWRKAYQDTAIAVVGCPRLDFHHRRSGGRDVSTPVDPTVAVAFHSDLGLCQETRSAWRAYARHLPALAERYHVIGHAHPRLLRHVQAEMRRAGCEVVHDSHEVIARADLLAADNTSLLPEFASTGKPVLWLNVPWYRRDVHHGGRFWEWPAGQVACDDPADLADAVAEALDDPSHVRQARQAMVGSVYGACDGHAAERAACAVRSVLHRGHLAP